MAGGNYPLYPAISLNTAVVRFYGLSVQMDIPMGATRSVLLEVPAMFIRLVDQKIFFLQSAIDFKVTEGVTATAGTSIPLYCIDRNITIPTSITASLNPTGVSGGVDLIGGEHFQLTTDIIGGSERELSSISFITLQQNTNYLFSFTNAGTENITNLHYLNAWAE